MSALSYFLERDGIATTGISLVRENTESMQPPRALWVPFPLGRPLGKPGDSAFQHRVIAAGLALLDRATGPVLEDYPEDAPGVTSEAAPACPVAFARPNRETTGWAAALGKELQALTPWHDLGRRRRRGRTLVGLSANTIRDNIEKMGRLLDDGRLPLDDLGWFKAATEDAKAFYLEALTAQPGEYDQQALENVLWNQTALGAAILKFNKGFKAHPDTATFSVITAPRIAEHQESGS